MSLVMYILLLWIASGCASGEGGSTSILRGSSPLPLSAAYSFPCPRGILRFLGGLNTPSFSWKASDGCTCPHPALPAEDCLSTPAPDADPHSIDVLRVNNKLPCQTSVCLVRRGFFHLSEQWVQPPSFPISCRKAFLHQFRPCTSIATPQRTQPTNP